MTKGGSFCKSLAICENCLQLVSGGAWRCFEAQGHEDPVGLAPFALGAAPQHGEGGVVVQVLALTKILNGFAPRIEVGAKRGDLFGELVFVHLGFW